MAESSNFSVRAKKARDRSLAAKRKKEGPPPTMFVISELVGGPAHGERAKILRGVKEISVTVLDSGEQTYRGSGDGSPMAWVSPEK